MVTMSKNIVGGIYFGNEAYNSLTHLLLMSTDLPRTAGLDDRIVFESILERFWKTLRRQCGRVVRAPSLKSGGRGFKFRSDH